MPTTTPDPVDVMLKHVQNMEAMFQQQQQQQAQQQKQTDAMFKQQQALIQQLIDGNSNSSSGSGLSSQGGGSVPRSSQPRAISGVQAPKLAADSTISNFNSWKSNWEDYFQTQQLSNHPLESQVATLKSCLDEEIKRFMRQDVIQVPSGGNVEQILDALKSWIKKKHNCLLDRRDFYDRRQGQSEPFDNFFADIKELYACSDFLRDDSCATCTANSSEALRDRILTGIYCNEIREKLLAEKSLTLEKAVEMCRAIESAALINKGMSSNSGSLNRFKKESSYKKQKKQNSSGNSAQSSDKFKGSSKSGDSSANPCSKCGYSKHTTSDGKCPAEGITCNKCGKMGHKGSMCQSKSKKSGRLKLCRVEKVDDFKAELATKVKGSKGFRRLEWLPDTGSDVNAVNVKDLKALGGDPNKLEPDTEEVRSVGGHLLKSEGVTQVVIRPGRRKLTLDVHVYKKLDDAILSRKTLVDLGWISPNWPLDMLQIRAVKTKDSVSSGPVSSSDTVSSDPEKPATKESLLNEFSSVFNEEELPPMNTTPMKIKLKPDAVPFKVNGARSIPFAFRDTVKAQLDKWESQSVIEKVEGPCDWCHAVVLVDKKGTDEKRLTVDLTKLNRQVETVQHPSRTVKDAIESIKRGSKFFTTLDAKNGYFQVPLEEESRPLTTFATQWGRYRFCRVPQGYVSSGDEYNQRTDAAFDGVPNMVKIVDDILVFTETWEDHVKTVRMVLERAKKNSITLSPKKFKFAECQVNYCGFQVGENGWEIEEEKIKSIQKFPLPVNRTDLRSLYGLAMQFGAHSEVSKLCEVLRPLMKETNAFHWEEEHTRAVDGLRERLSRAPILAFYDPALPTKLETDASRTKGLGFVLWQKHGDTWKLIQVGSRFLSDTETRYAMIELELLAVVWAYQKCRLFLEGKDFELVIDHKPLVPILNSYSLDRVENSRLVRLLLKIQDAKFEARWVRGADHKVADALSRAPVDDPKPEDEYGEKKGSPSGIRALRARALESVVTQDVGIQKLKIAAFQDPNYQALLRQVLEGFPVEKGDLAAELHPFWSARNDLTTDDGLVLRNQRLVIPRSMQREVLDELHASHQGQTKTKRRARQVVYWPRINQDIDNIVSSCQACAERQASQVKEPLMRDQDPQFPFEDTSADLFSHNGVEYLVFADKMSGWPFFKKIGRSATSSDVIRAIRSWFSVVGAPRRLTTDNGPQFDSHRFKEFCRRWHIIHDPSTPRYPQSNGHAEVMVKAVKRVIQKVDTANEDAIDKAILELRNSPRADGRSPAQVLFGRPLKSCVPSHWTAYLPKWQKAAQDADALKEDIVEKSKAHYDKTAKPLKEFKVGVYVSVQNPSSKLWDRYGRIVGVGKRRDYHIKMPSGRILWRNRRFLRFYKPAVPGFGGSSQGAEPQSRGSSGAEPVPQTSQNPDVPEVPRRSTRTKRKPTRFQAKKSGKSHD